MDWILLDVVVKRSYIWQVSEFDFNELSNFFLHCHIKNLKNHILLMM